MTFVGSVFLLVVMMPWNNEDVHAGPFVAAFKGMGLPYADRDERGGADSGAVVPELRPLYRLACSSCSRAGVRPLPAWSTSAKKGVPANAILASSTVVFLCVIAAAISPHGCLPVPPELLGRGHPLRLRADRRFPAGATPAYRSGEAAPEDVAVPVPDHRRHRRHAGDSRRDVHGRGHPLAAPAPACSPECHVLVGFAANKWRLNRLGDFHDAPAVPAPPGAGARQRDRRCSRAAPRAAPDGSDRQGRSTSSACPQTRSDTHRAEHSGAVWVWEATVKAAQERLDTTLAALRSEA